MEIHISAEQLREGASVLLIAIVVLAIISVVLYVITKNSDNKKPLMTKQVKILEKPVQQGNIEWYIVEFDNGERCKLRNLNANKVLISIGDVGIMKYRGKTIESFQRTR